MYFRNKEERTQSHYKVFILNHLSEFYITSPLKALAETWVSFPKLFVKKCSNRGLRYTPKVFSAIKKSMYATTIVKKEQMYISREDQKHFSIMFILLVFVMSQADFMNLILIF